MSEMKKCGRPAGRIKTAKVEVKLDPLVKDAFMEKLRLDGKTASCLIGEWIRLYLKKNPPDDIGQ